MPTYVFFCTACKKQFEKAMSVAQRSKTKLSCPHCKSDKVQQLITSFYARTSRKA